MEKSDHVSSKRVFINNIDSYSSGMIAEVLCECAVAAPEEERAQDAHRLYEVVGSTEAPESHGKGRPGGVLEQYHLPKREELFSKLLECDVIIYNITQHAMQVEEAHWAVTALHAEMEHFTGSKMFVLVSTVMSWALTAPLALNEDGALTEDDFRRRRPHPNFKPHQELEKRVTKLGKTDRARFSTYVLASGLQYGMGEQLFHHFFKMSWLGQSTHIPVFGVGSNIVPTVHIKDLASVILKVVQQKPRLHYLLAVDSSSHSMEEIVMAISNALGPGSIQKEPLAEAFLIRDMSVLEIDHLTVDLQMDSVHLEQLCMSWHCESGLVENIELVVEEYRERRGLQPLRVCVLGPPAAGKSTVAKHICEQYRLHHITVKSVISEAIAQQREVLLSDPSRQSEACVNALELLRSMKRSMEQNGGQVDEELVVKFLREKLMSKPCRNQGFVLDGFPKSFKQAKELFASECSSTAENGTPSFKKITPDFVFILEASDIFLKERVLHLPQAEVEENDYHLEHYLPRLSRFRENNTQDQTLADYWREQATPCVTLAVENGSSNELRTLLLVHSICVALGQPRTYSPGPEEVEVEEWRKMKIQEKEEIATLGEDIDTTTEPEQVPNLSLQCPELEEQLKKKSGPMRTYLMEHLIPTLSLALIECCSVQVDDPLDFLAETLFKNSPLFY